MRLAAIPKAGILTLGVSLFLRLELQNPAFSYSVKNTSFLLLLKLVPIRK